MKTHSDKQLDRQSILRALLAEDRQAMASCAVLDSIDSTNSYLFRAVKQDTPSGMYDVCCAATQTDGRGRMGRSWNSPDGGIYLSVRSGCAETVPVWLSLAAAVEAATVLEKYGASRVKVKWPNDLYCDGGKLGGILVERKHHLCVVGIGLNCTPAADPQGADYAYTCLEQLGIRAERTALIASLISALMRAFVQSRQVSWNRLTERYARFDCLRGKPVRVFAHDGTVTEGIGVGVAENAGFCVEHPEGQRVYQAGEVRIRE